MKRKVNCTWLFALPMAVLLAAFIGAQPAAALTGAIFTTKGDGTTVNLNNYSDCTDVYLNGGPQNEHNPGLPDGTYYFQVTDPSGSDLLSTDNAECRQLTVSSGRVAGAAGPACKHPNGTFNPANSSTPVQLAPFDTTPNAGLEYKVWLIAQTLGTSIDGTDPKVIHFSNSDSKTDNFKVQNACGDGGGGGGGATNTISGVKFYDANVDGLKNNSEPGIQFWKIFIFGGPEGFTPYDTTTGPNGSYQFQSLEPGTYGVCEVLPSNAPKWVPTTPTQITEREVPPDSTDNNFGNVCLGPGGGMTLGFWSNKNGRAILQANDPAWRNLLNSLNLRNASGVHFTVPGGLFCNTSACTTGAYPTFRTWLLGANATNMAYMLSAQLAAMELNVLTGKVAGSSVVYAPGCGDTTLNSNGNFITINKLMTDADAQLAANPITTAASDPPNRSIQECLKNALDAANNNTNFVQASPCDLNYSGVEPSCVP